MIEEAVVIRRRGTVLDVVLAAAEGCTKCGACSASGGSSMLLRDVRDESGARVGDTVRVEIPERVRLDAALALYVVPVAALFVGYLAGFLLGTRTGTDPDLTGAAGAVVLFAAALLGVRVRERVLARRGTFRPVVHAIIARGPAPEAVSERAERDEWEEHTRE